MDLIIALGAGCLLIRLGSALHQTGLIRAKNAAGTVLRTLCDLCVAALAFWAVGAAILSGDRRMIFPSDGGTDLFFMMTVVLIGTAVVSGAMAERSRFFALCAGSLLLAALVIPAAARQAWSGTLHRMGFIDIGGGAWLHTAAAAVALAGAIALGARTGKYHHDGSSSIVPGHNVPLAGFGVLAMLAGWVPYLVGCLVRLRQPDLIPRAAVDVLLSGAAAGLAATLLGRLRYGKPDVILTLFGFTGGLVAISAGAGRVPPAGAVVIGAVAGILVPLASIAIDLFGRVDDPTGAVAVHSVGGLWGTPAVGLFVAGDVGHLRLILVQLVGVIVIALFALAAGLLVFGALRLAGTLRAGESEEFEGLDLAEHDIGAYPDFQQTMIKSYHLREA